MAIKEMTVEDQAFLALMEGLSSDESLRRDAELVAEFATELELYRTRHGLSRTELANALRVSTSSIHQWERGVGTAGKLRLPLKHNMLLLAAIVEGRDLPTNPMDNAPRNVSVTLAPIGDPDSKIVVKSPTIVILDYGQSARLIDPLTGEETGTLEGTMFLLLAE